MSYSFSVKATTKDAARRGVADELRRVVEAQPGHDDDSTIAMNAAASAIDLLTDDPTKDVNVGMYGSIQRVGTGPIFGVGMTINAYLTPRT